MGRTSIVEEKSSEKMFRSIPLSYQKNKSVSFSCLQTYYTRRNRKECGNCFKHLGEHKAAVLLIILLLVGQAYCDLALPSTPRILWTLEYSREVLKMPSLKE